MAPGRVKAPSYWASRGKNGADSMVGSSHCGTKWLGLKFSGARPSGPFQAGGQLRQPTVTWSGGTSAQVLSAHSTRRWIAMGHRLARIDHSCRSTPSGAGGGRAGPSRAGSVSAAGDGGGVAAVSGCGSRAGVVVGLGAGFGSGPGDETHATRPRPRPATRRRSADTPACYRGCVCAASLMWHGGRGGGRRWSSMAPPLPLRRATVLDRCRSSSGSRCRAA